MEQIRKLRRDRKDLLKAATAIRKTSPVSADALKEKATNLEKEIGRKVEQRGKAKERRLLFDKAKEALNSLIYQANLFAGETIVTKMRGVEPPSGVPLIIRVIANQILSNKEWLSGWDRFYRGEGLIEVPALIVPGPRRKRTFNMVITSNHEQPCGFLGKDGCIDSRFVLSSLYRNNLFGSSVFFCMDSKLNKIDDLILTGQVDMVIFNSSRPTYDDWQAEHITKFVSQHNLRKPVFITPYFKLLKEDWADGYMHLFKSMRKA